MSTHVTATLSITRTAFEIELEVEGNVEPIVHGHYSGPPERCFPDEGADRERHIAFQLVCQLGVLADDVSLELRGKLFPLPQEKNA